VLKVFVMDASLHTHLNACERALIALLMGASA
jgi:hypothetical protein